MTIELSTKEKNLYEKAKDFSISNFTSAKNQWMDCDKAFKDVMKIFSDNGYCGLGLPSKLEGQQYSFLEQVLIYEGLSYGCGALSFLLQIHNNVTKEISSYYDTSKGIKELVSDMAVGKKINTRVLTEEHTDIATSSSITPYAELKSGGYHIYGKKRWVANAAEADCLTLMVKEGSPDSENILMLLVDIDTPGLTVGEGKPIMGLKAMSCCDMKLNNCIVSKKRLLSDKVDKNTFEAIENSQILMPSIAIGIAQRVIDLTVNYLGRRISFDKPIIQRQGVQWTLAELSTKVEAGRWLAYRTASLRDRKKNISLQALKNKLYATEVTMEATTKCLQLFGAQGYAENSVVSKNWALSKLLQIVDGIPEIQKLS